jgi:hypothetical protein
VITTLRLAVSLRAFDVLDATLPDVGVKTAVTVFEPA